MSRLLQDLRYALPALTAQLRATVAALDADTPVAETQTMEAAMGAWAAERRLIMLLVTGFAAIALLLGMVGALAVTRLLAGLLFHIRPTDPLTFTGTALALAAVAAGATLLPAVRALRTDPAHALRSD